MAFIEEGLAVLKTLISPEVFAEIDQAKAHQYALRDKSSSDDVHSLIHSSESYLVLHDQLPRSPENAQRWLEETKHYFPSESINAFINDIPDDPHSRFDLASLHKAIASLGIDAKDDVTTMSFKPELLLIFATGNGQVVSKLIELLKPRNIAIIVSNWEEWLSSFETTNWLEIWNEYCIRDNHTISAFQTTNSVAAIAYLVKDHLATLDHAFIYLSPIASEDTKETHSRAKSGLIDRQIAYKGFAMDEYNMIVNSWKTLQCKPKVFRFPTLIDNTSDYLIVGSGPSLDNSFDFIKQNQNNYIIVACASSYGTLREHGIIVDILCLLERGAVNDCMVEQYTKAQEKYGNCGTKLLCSTTIPYQILSLFEDPMVFFRPSLSPISIFVEDPKQMLVNEGPQTINTGVAFAFSQRARSITLCGVDLGTASSDSVRASNAIGHTDRIFDIERKGNLRDIVYTNENLLDASIILEQLAPICLERNISLYNVSDGIHINGWDSLDISNCSFSPLIPQQKEILKTWWSKQTSFSQKAFSANLKASNVRRNSFRLFENLRRLVNAASLSNWTQSKYEICEVLDITDKYKYHTLCPRIIRGSITRIVLAINRQLIVMSKYDDPIRSRFLESAKVILISRLDFFQQEIFSLFDYLETTST